MVTVSVLGITAVPEAPSQGVQGSGFSELSFCSPAVGPRLDPIQIGLETLFIKSS